MVMGARTVMNTWRRRMPTNTGVLTLAQWLSPAFPVGAFAYSHGLETVIQQGQLKTSQDLQAWLEDVLVHGSGRSDCILLGAAYLAQTPQARAEVDAIARAFCASAERLMETTLQGEAFCKTVSDVWAAELTGLTYPVAVGAAAQRLDIAPSLAASMYLQAFLSNLVSAAVRAVPLGQTEGQAVLAALTPLIESVVADCAGCTVDDLHSAAFLSDIAAMQHETLNSRIFRS